MSKILEKVVSAQLCSFLLKNDIYEEFQSGLGPVIAQKLHLLKLQMTRGGKSTKILYSSKSTITLLKFYLSTSKSTSLKIYLSKSKK